MLSIFYMKKNKKQNKSHRIFLNTLASIHSDSFTRHFLAIAMRWSMQKRRFTRRDTRRSTNSVPVSGSRKGPLVYPFKWLPLKRGWKRSVRLARITLTPLFIDLIRLLYWFWEKNRLFCSLRYWICRRLRSFSCFRRFDIIVKTRNDDGYHVFPPKWRWFARAPLSTKKISYSS